MPLEIHFVDRTREAEARVTRFEMKANSDGWVIPELRIAPAQDRSLLISRLTTDVINDPEKRGLSSAAVAGRIRAAFPNQTSDPPKLLSRSRSLVGMLIPDAGELPPNFEGDLTVTVHYFESRSGKPDGIEQSVTQTCRLYSRRGELPPPDLSVSPSQLPLTTGTQGTFLVRARFAATDDPPKFTLAHPETVVAPGDPQTAALSPALTDLRTALVTALAVSPTGPERSGDRRTYQQTVLVQPSSQCKNVLEGLAHGLEVPLDVSLPGRKGLPVRCSLVLESERHPFPGWVVMDFGTSNSTTTVHDPHVIDPAAGLPTEQLRYLQEEIKKWFGKNNKEGFNSNHVHDQEWRTYVGELTNLMQPEGIEGCFGTNETNKFYRLLAEIEIGLQGRSSAFQRVFLKDLQHIYHQALRVPTLEKYNLYPITLEGLRGKATLLSEMEIIGVQEVSKSFSLFDVRMGETVRAERQKAIAKADGAGLKEILTRFHPSPKRYFGTDRQPYTVELNGKQHLVTVDDLMLAGWRHMLGLAGEARDRKKDGLKSEGQYRKVILTYPTVAPPSVRGRIQALIRRLGIADVRTDYDEAVAAAIFYLMREYAAVAEMGLESFKARCRVREDKTWVQNVLVFDIGGGTTDVALIRLTVKDVPVFEPTDSIEERGAGGRFYRIEPRLLSSTGDMQLGGELMTLRLFRLLKASLADTLLTLAQNRKLSSDPLSRILAGNVPETFTEKGKFRPGSLRKFFEQEAPEFANSWQQAKNLADQILPTRWGEDGENRAARFQAFDELWKMAEAAKIELGVRRTNPNDHRAPYITSDKDLHNLIGTCRPELASLSADQFKGINLELHAEQFEITIKKVINEAVMLAMGTLEHLGPDEKVDWLILSGQSCNLELVDKEIRRLFASSDKFVWNPERVTFEKKYAKLATSLGACFAEEYRRRNVRPQAYRDKLRQGLNFLEYSINNLFSTLPCYFELLLAAGGSRSLFRAGQELFELDPPPPRDEDRRAKARSGWLDSAMQMTVHRQDYKHGPDGCPGRMTLWGDFSAQTRLVNELKIPEAEWRSRIRVQFEVDHRLDVDVLVCRFEEGQTEPDYVVRAAESQCNLGPAVIAAGRPAAAPTAAPANKPNAAPGSNPPPADPSAPTTTLFDPAGKLLWEIALRTPNTEGFTTIFKAGQVLNTRFHPAEAGGQVRRGILNSGDPLDRDRFPGDGKLEVYGRPAGTIKWERLGVIKRPNDEPVFRRRHRLTLSEDGVIRVHDGEPTYRETRDNPAVLRDQPGYVYRTRLEQEERKMDEERDPYSGKH